jgi:hypothetical protein
MGDNGADSGHKQFRLDRPIGLPRLDDRRVCRCLSSHLGKQLATKTITNAIPLPHAESYLTTALLARFFTPSLAGMPTNARPHSGNLSALTAGSV